MRSTDGTRAKEMQTLQPGGTFEHGSFVSHRWYAWVEGTEGNILSDGVALGQWTLDQIGELHEIEIAPR